MEQAANVLIEIPYSKIFRLVNNTKSLLFEGRISQIRPNLI